MKQACNLLIALVVLYVCYVLVVHNQQGAGIPVAQASGVQVARVQRLDQNDPAQYNTQAGYTTWSPSACSAASIAAVLNFYGRRERVTDVLQVEIANGDISSGAGLLSHAGIVRTAAHYGFSAVLNEHDSLTHVIETANSGHPVIVNWPPGRFGSGHFVVVTGGNASTVFLADSSSYDYHSLARGQFLQYWAGFSAVVTPQ